MTSLIAAACAIWLASVSPAQAGADVHDTVVVGLATLGGEVGGAVLLGSITYGVGTAAFCRIGQPVDPDDRHGGRCYLLPLAVMTAAPGAMFGGMAGAAFGAQKLHLPAGRPVLFSLIGVVPGAYMLVVSVRAEDIDLVPRVGLFVLGLSAMPLFAALAANTERVAVAPLMGRGTTGLRVAVRL